MTETKVSEVVGQYRATLLNVLRVEPKQGPIGVMWPDWSVREKVAHQLYLCDSIEQFLKDGRLEKAMRWLGFLQGTLCACGAYTIEQLKYHNRPE